MIRKKLTIFKHKGKCYQNESSFEFSVAGGGGVAKNDFFKLLKLSLGLIISFFSFKVNFVLKVFLI